MWDELTDEELAAEMLAASARIDAAHHTLMSLAREQNRRCSSKLMPNRTIRSDDDEFAPGECDGSGTCSAPIHVHGCYTPHRSDQCDSPDEYGHTDRTIGSPDDGAP
ncbi:hypothetical protein [Microbacterium xylanilyticum]